VCNSVSNTLGMSMEPLPYAQFSELRQQVTDGTIVGAFRSGWQADVPSMGDFLSNSFKTGAGANDVQYSSAAVDDLLDRATQTMDDDEAFDLYTQVQEQLFADLPVIPLWYQNGFGGYSTNVSNVTFGWNAMPRYEAVTTTAAGGVVRVNDAEPQNPLVPTNTNETGGGRIVDLLFAGLVSYEADGSVKNEVAKSIETDDNQNFTVELEDGWTFSDGSPVTADSFINAWNYGARLGNKQLNSSYYEIIEGFSDEEDRETLTGLEKIDDLTFTIRLKAPSSDLRLRLGMAAFYPLPESAYDDMEAFGAAPIGNGPYSMTTWDHNSQVVLTKSATYQGNRQAQNEGITFVIYTDYDAAYNDLRSNSLDVLDAIPNSALSSFTDDLGDRAINQPGAVIQCFAIRTDVEHWKMDDEGRARRAALSRAINRKQICDTLYYNTRTPASDFTSPAIHGWTDRIPGNEVLQYDETEAKNQWANAEAIAQY
jgi:ABC-type oligopeptide transport system, periplasmic component